MVHYKLFLNKKYGVDFLLAKKLEKEGIEYDYISHYEEGKADKELYKKYNIKSTPVLLTFYEDKDGYIDEVCGRLTNTDDIVEFFKQIKEDV